MLLLGNLTLYLTEQLQTYYFSTSTLMKMSENNGWWFFGSFAYTNSDGQYIDSVNPATDPNEKWVSFCKRFSKYRHRSFYYAYIV